MKRILALMLFSASAGTVFFSCKHSPGPEPLINGGTGNGNNNGIDENEGNAVDTSLCFERDILPIFIANCAKSGCHDAASREDGYVFDSWQNITSRNFKPGDAKASKLYKAITSDELDDRMPQAPNPPLTPAQVALIKDWIDRGAPNSTGCSDGTVCDSTVFTFSGAVKPILLNNCLGCHNNATLSGGFSFETYNGVIAAVNSGKFLGALRHEPGFPPMPKNLPKLSDCQMLKIEKWIANGAQNN